MTTLMILRRRSQLLSLNLLVLVLLLRRASHLLTHLLRALENRLLLKNLADQILRELQNNLDMWLQVVHIMQKSENLITKFFALQAKLSYLKLTSNGSLGDGDAWQKRQSKFIFFFFYFENGPWGP